MLTGVALGGAWTAALPKNGCMPLTTWRCKWPPGGSAGPIIGAQSHCALVLVQLGKTFFEKIGAAFKPFRRSRDARPMLEYIYMGIPETLRAMIGMRCSSAKATALSRGLAMRTWLLSFSLTAIDAVCSSVYPSYLTPPSCREVNSQHCHLGWSCLCAFADASFKGVQLQLCRHHILR